MRMITLTHILAASGDSSPVYLEASVALPHGPIMLHGIVADVTAHEEDLDYLWDKGLVELGDEFVAALPLRMLQRCDPITYPWWRRLYAWVLRKELFQPRPWFEFYIPILMKEAIPISVTWPETREWKGQCKVTFAFMGVGR